VKLDDIVITGYGIKAPGICDKSSFLEVLKNGICTQSLFKDPLGEPIVAGMIHDDFIKMNEKNYKRLSRSYRMAIAAALDAVNMSGLCHYEPQRIAVIMGTSAGAICEIEENSKVAFQLKSMPIQAVSWVDTHTLSESVAQAIGSCGPSFTLTTGCTASIDATLMGKLLLESGSVDACIVGGTDAPLGKWTINAFKKLRSLSTETCIQEAGVPFSNKHNGFVLAEGAGVLVMERKQSAEARGQKSLGKIERVVSRNEAQGLLKSDTSGKHMLNVFQEAVGNSQPCYVNSQALGIDTNDEIERFILKETFGDKVPITSIKGMMGHAFGAMGAIQMISSLLSMEYGFIPPTIKSNGHGFRDIPIVYETRDQEVDSVCITTHGNSGNNACLLLTSA
jgi:3-oxoacyl-(acyl-carrier-protein) synthase